MSVTKAGAGSPEQARRPELPAPPAFTLETNVINPVAGDSAEENSLAGEIVTLRLPILRETWDQIIAFAAQQGWDPDEGLRIVVANGLSYLATEQQVSALNAAALAGAPDLAGRLDALARQLADYQAMYAVMKFRAFEWQQRSRTLEQNVQGYRATERFWDGWGAQVRAQLFRLDAANKELQERLAACETARPPPTAPASPVRAGWRRRLLGR